MRVEPHDNGALLREVPENNLVLSPCKNLARKQPTMHQEVDPHQTLNLPGLDIRPPILQNSEKYTSVVNKLLSLWCSMITLSL